MPQCRPRITGAATLAFACEEFVLARIPNNNLDECYRELILPAVQRIDQEYMAQATFFSDFKLLINTLARRWDTAPVEQALKDVLEREETPSLDSDLHSRISVDFRERRSIKKEQLYRNVRCTPILVRYLGSSLHINMPGKGRSHLLGRIQISRALAVQTYFGCSSPALKVGIVTAWLGISYKYILRSSVERSSNTR
jgi:hypothetical protein